jgi:hypothetical protein
MRQDSVVGFQNYTVPLASYAGITETALLAPFSSGYYPGLPSPEFPLSTATYPVVLPISVPPDVSGGELDGHPFEVVIAGTVTGAATCTFDLKLWQASNAVLQSGITSATYATLLTHPPSGTGINGLVGSSAVTLSSSVKTNFRLKAPFIWDSTSKQLNFAGATEFYAIGATATPTVTNASLTSIGQTDLNFFPTFTWGTAFGGSLILSEFAINRV